MATNGNLDGWGNPKPEAVLPDFEHHDFYVGPVIDLLSLCAAEHKHSCLFWYAPTSGRSQIEKKLRPHLPWRTKTEFSAPRRSRAGYRMTGILD